MAKKKLAAERDQYLQQLNLDALTLTNLRSVLRRDTTATAVLDDVQAVAQRLSGSALLRGFEMVGISASALEEAVVESRSVHGKRDRLFAALDSLLTLIELEQSELRIAFFAPAERHSTTVERPALTPP